MDQATMQERAEEHGQAVVRGDMDAVAADIVEELHPQLPQVVDLLPQPTTNAEVLSIDAQGDHAIVEIRYSNDEKSVTLRSRWEDRDPGPQLVDVAPVD
jgi:hypothetical protein